MTTERLEAFSDGVFAFAITLLVLNITIPNPGKETVTAAWLWHELGSHWPDYLSYATSFLVIAIMWTNHHALFTRLRTMDRHLIMFNMLLLMGTVLIPFSTALIARFPTLTPAAFTYGFVLTWTAVAFNLLLRHIVNVPSCNDFAPGEIKVTIRRYNVGLTVYSGATVIALFAPLVSVLAYVAITLYFFIPGGIDRPSDHEELHNVHDSRPAP